MQRVPAVRILPTLSFGTYTGDKQILEWAVSEIMGSIFDYEQNFCYDSPDVS